MELNHREKTVSVAREKAILAACLLPGDGLDPHDPLGELTSLAETAGAEVVGSVTQRRIKPNAKTFIGEGKVQELAESVKFHGAQVVLFENNLSPSQLANIEKVVGCKILDRTELILDIFAFRASTAEAKLQVSLSQLMYTYPRLKNMWTHLERTAGGVGTRGPGEQQLETDRRIVQVKRLRIEKELAEIEERKKREVEARNDAHFTVGIVGYTNAGKSTLFNTLTAAGTYADDKLFATLSTLTRKWKIAGGEWVALSDTVGFVRNLPHRLVASFKATLEEAVHANLLVIVVDVADRDARKRLDTVMEVLKDIGAGDVPKIIALNKVDAIESNAELLMLTSQFPSALPISAKTGRGLEQLTAAVAQYARGADRELVLTVPLNDGKTLQFLEGRVPILAREYDEAGNVQLTVKIGETQLGQLQANASRATWEGKKNKAKKGWDAEKKAELKIEEEESDALRRKTVRMARRVDSPNKESKKV